MVDKFLIWRGDLNHVNRIDVVFAASAWEISYAFYNYIFVNISSVPNILVFYTLL